jgi:hypothetical protein
LALSHMGTFCEQDQETCTWRMDVDEQMRRDARVETRARGRGGIGKQPRFGDRVCPIGGVLRTTGETAAR